MSIRAKPRDQATGRKVTPPSPSYMNNSQFSSYLADLRTSRMTRPGGARPLPGAATSGTTTSGSSGSSTHGGFFGSHRRGSSHVSSSAARNSLSGTSIDTATAHTHQRGSGSDSTGHQPTAIQSVPADAGSTQPSYASMSSSVASRASRYSTVTGHGRDYYPASHKATTSMPPPLRPGEVVPTDTYMENGQRWMEKEEAVSLRRALEDMDLKAKLKDAPASISGDVDQQLYNAALNEAADLVWQHQHGIKPPEPGAPYRYRQHLRKNSYAHARTASVGRYGNDIEPTGLARDPASRSVSDSSSSSASSCEGSFAASQRSRYSYTGSRSTRVASGGSGSHSASGSADNSARPSLDRNGTAIGEAARRPSKSYSGIATSGPRPMPGAFSAASQSNGARRRSSMKRNISGEIEKPFSGDQIYEEPETATPEKRATETLGKAATAGIRGAVLQARDTATNVSTDNQRASIASKNANHGVSKLVSRYEIHRNPPTQSHNPHYTTNTAHPHTYLQQKQDKPTESAVKSAVTPAPLQVPRKNGVEIRSDEIRQATSMKLKDRNPKLPTPSYVSDNPGRPIVSFDGNWKAPADEAATDAKAGARERNCFDGGGNGGKRSGMVTNGVIGSTHINSNQFDESVPKDQKDAFSQVPSGPSASSSASFCSSPAVSSQQQQQQRRQQEQAQRPFHNQPHSISVNGLPTQGPTSGGHMPPIPTIAVAEEPEPTKTSTLIAAPSISISPDPSERSASSTQAPIPTIVLPGDCDNNEDENPTATAFSNIPIIVTPDDSRPPVAPAKASTRPLPTPIHGAAGTSTSRPRGHWSRAPAHYPSSSTSSATGSTAGNRATARCHACREPIEGRFVALAGIPGLSNAHGASGAGSGSERFHPECFRCYACGTTLEALEISPEPDAARSARLHRIGRRAQGEVLDEQPGETMAEDGDDRLRFYCHLDWHELFAPRCKHCTTPIMGEHVVALGAHWHVGHFFCAECGDPFGPGATHIEKDGYAWCVGCQARRTERRAPKCRACGKAVIGQYVQALGAEWHDECFRCGVCGGGFMDGQVFPREGGGGLMQVVCTGCRQRELKA